MATAVDVLMDMVRQRNARDIADQELMNQSIQNIGTTVSNMNQNSIAQRELLLKEQKTKAEIAQLPQDNLIKTGQTADAVTKMIQSGMLTPQDGRSILDSLNSYAPAARLNEYLSTPDPSLESQTKESGVTPKATSAPANDLFATETNVIGVPKELKSESGLIREQEIQAKGEAAKATIKAEGELKAGADKGAMSTRRFLQQYERSVKELEKDFPDFGKVGFTGKLQRVGLNVLEKADAFPETTVLIRQAEKMANQTARDIEGGRVTDQDRAVYAKTLANTITTSSPANIRLTSNELLNLADRGGDISGVLKEFSSSKVEVMQEIVKQVLAGLDEEQLKQFAPSGDK